MESMRIIALSVLFACVLSSINNVLADCPPEEDEVVCPEPYSFVRHPDCRFYYRCTNYIPTCTECTGGQYFNPLTERCDDPGNVPDCIDGTYRPPTTTTEMTTSTTTTTTPTTTTTMVTTTTPTTTPTTTTTMVTTTTPTTTMATTTTTPTTTTTTTPTPVSTTTFPFICPPEGVHTFPHPDSCSLYIRCFDAVPYVLDCSPLKFDRIDLTCKPEEDAVCDDDGTWRCPAEGYTEIPHDTTCSKYFVCFDGDQFELDCAANTYFDATPAVLRCNLAELALCNSECPRTGTHYLPIRARPCKWYKICIEGYSANVACADGEAYDPEVEECVSLESYTCPYT